MSHKIDTQDPKPLAYIVFDASQAVDQLLVETLAQRCGLAVMSPAQAMSNNDVIKIMFSQDQWRVHLDNGGAVVSVDFAEPRFYARASHTGLQGEYVVRAVLGRKKTTQPLRVLDATAGFGHDAFLLAAAGCHVTLVEQMPLLAYLLEQAVVRASLSANDLLASAAARMTVTEANSVTLMQQWSANRPDVVYLDPMYAHADDEGKRGLKKTAAVKKNMAFLQRLTTDKRSSAGAKTDAALYNSDGEGMIEAALTLATSKVVVKRAPGAEWLGGIKPASSLTGKAARFDIYPVN